MRFLVYSPPEWAEQTTNIPLSAIAKALKELARSNDGQLAKKLASKLEASNLFVASNRLVDPGVVPVNTTLWVPVYVRGESGSNSYSLKMTRQQAGRWIITEICKC
jgi:hypothetical protein